MSEKIEWFAEHFIAWPLMFLVGSIAFIGMFVGIPYGIYSYVTYKPPETFSLRIDSWACSKEHKEEVRVCAKSCGWRTDIICDQWSAK